MSSLLHGNGYRFRLHRRNLPGKPDVVLPKYDSVKLVHGCFWLRHNGCRFACSPKSRFELWCEKITRNVQHDTEILAALQSLGWKALVVWECQATHIEKLTDHLREFLKRPVLIPDNNTKIGVHS